MAWFLCLNWVKVRVKTPIIDALINIGCVVCKSNFGETGRTPKLGIDTLENELLKLFRAKISPD